MDEPPLLVVVCHSSCPSLVRGAESGDSCMDEVAVLWEDVDVLDFACKMGKIGPTVLLCIGPATPRRTSGSKSNIAGSPVKQSIGFVCVHTTASKATNVIIVNPCKHMSVVDTKAEGYYC